MKLSRPTRLPVPIPAKLPTSTIPTWTRPTIEAKGLAPLRPQLEAIAAIRDKHELARALGESLRADVDRAEQLRTFIPRTFSDCGWRPVSTTPSTMPPTCCKAAWKCPTANTTFPTATACVTFAPSIRRTFQPCSNLPDSPTPTLRAQRIVELEHAIAEKHLALADEQDIQKANNAWKQAEFAANAPGPRLGRVLSRRRSQQPGQLHRLAADSLRRRVRSSRLYSARNVERLAGLSPD